MGRSRLNQVINALQVAGLRTARGYVPSAMPEPSEPVAAVYVQEMTQQACKVAVAVYTTAAQGGVLCEDRALDVMQQLQKLGAQCRMGSCSFDGRTGLFSVVVTAAFQQLLPFGVLIDGQRQAYATKLSIAQCAQVYRVTDPDTGVATTSSVEEGWEITLVEQLPENTPPEPRAKESFTFTVQHPGGVEQYVQCHWQRCTLERTPEGMHRTRVARTWAEKIVAQG